MNRLAQEIGRCRECPLYQEAKNPVPGEGRVPSDLMFVGEGPGLSEDRQGRPFVGSAGRLLNRLLEGIGLHREEVFITNVVKHRPPNNRDPHPEEISACWPWLERQIALVEPKVIVCLGRYAMLRLMPFVEKRKITEIHGQPFSGPEGRVYIAVYHPASALYQQSLLSDLEADFSRIAQVLRELRGESSEGLGPLSEG